MTGRWAPSVPVGWVAAVVMALSACAEPPNTPGAVDTVGTAGRVAPPPASATADDHWSPLSVLPVVDPGDFGAVGDGLANDTEAVRGAIDAIAAGGGGIVFFEPGMTYRTTQVLRITGDHVKLWSPNGGAELFAETDGREGVRALILEDAHAVGLFGLRSSSDVDRRRTGLEDSAIVVDGGSATEIVGLEITDSASAAVMVFGGSTGTLVDGNYIHDTWADGIHFTDGADGAWVWNNIFTTSSPADGDDGIACVTYGSGSRCRDMEWWNNLHLGAEWGRGLAVVGGEDIVIHHNTVCRTAAAGILVASEESYDTPGSERIRIVDNVVIGAGRVVPHAGILISGLSGELSDIVVRDNVVADSVTGEPFRVEGDVDGIDQTNTTVERPDGTVCPEQHEIDPQPKDTSVLATRDRSFVDEEHRRGLYRVLVRQTSDGRGFEQQFEYVALDRGSDVDGLLRRGDVAVERFSAGDAPESATADDVLLIRSAHPLDLPDGLDAVTFEDLRRLAAERPALWAALDER